MTNIGKWISKHLTTPLTKYANLKSIYKSDACRRTYGVAYHLVNAQSFKTSLDAQYYKSKHRNGKRKNNNCGCKL